MVEYVVVTYICIHVYIFVYIHICKSNLRHPNEELHKQHLNFKARETARLMCLGIFCTQRNQYSLKRY